MQIASLIDNAFAKHRAGALPQAETLYRAVLDIEPQNLNALHLLGVLMLATQRADEAVGLLVQADILLTQRGDAEAGHAALYNNLGRALRAVGRGEDAACSYRRGLELEPANAECWTSLAATLAGLGRHAEAVDACSRALAINPSHFSAWDTLGHLLVALDRVGDAVEAFRAAAAADPQSWPTRLKLGQTLALAERHDEAAALLTQLAEEQPKDMPVLRELIHALFAAGHFDAALSACKRLPEDADAQFFAGRIHHAQHHPDKAEAAYRTVLHARPDDIDALCHLALLLEEIDRMAEAAEACRHLLSLQPEHATALCVLGTAQHSLGDRAAAIATYRHCLRAKPDFAKAHFNLGQLLVAQGRGAEAVASFESAIAARPDDPRALVELGNLLQDSDPQRSHACFVQAHHLRPLTTWPATQALAEFSVLLIMAPNVANVPVTYLVGKSNYAAHFVSLLPGIDYDIDFLRAHADVVVNLVSDADQGRAMLPLAGDLVRRLGQPVINHPDKIQRTDRAEISVLLADIPGCRIPKVVRVDRAELASGRETQDRFTLPTLLRIAGKHGGDDFDYIETPDALASFLARSPAEDYYAIQFIAYSSPDGYFRKYRLIFTDGGIYPYHLAIGDQWKVHHYTTSMGRHGWMQDEERAFLADPAAVFSPTNFAALRAIQAKVGLDHFGIDCSLDSNGDLVVFEVNASMLVHGDNTDFPYKDPYVDVIKAAFDKMLNKVARGQNLTETLVLTMST
jgi:tetratricopeptide (TPR) repeat protein